MAMRKIFVGWMAVLALAVCGAHMRAGARAGDAPARASWTEQEASAWYAKQGWPVGSNYLPATASNELEMWQAETFDPKRIDTELGWAEAIGLNTMRVFLHDLVW